MQTTFIAVQCFQCSTMQVKQKPKSSKKWTCVVCNEKQSFRNVFAQGFMAKDIRKFVQNFNMSRQKEEEMGGDGGDTALVYPRSCEDSNTNKRRTDWTEYVDSDPDEFCGKLDDSELEPMIVTEMPRALFKKPKFKEPCANVSDFGIKGKKLLKPVFRNRSNKFGSSPDMQVPEFQQTASKGDSISSDKKMISQDSGSVKEPIQLGQEDRALKWNILRAKIQDHNDSLGNKKAFTYQSTKNAASSTVSKWSEYMTNNNVECCATEPAASKELSSKLSNLITEDDDAGDLQVSIKSNSNDQFSQWSNDAFKPLMHEQRVEDDIHPDFL